MAGGDGGSTAMFFLIWNGGQVDRQVKSLYSGTIKLGYERIKNNCYSLDSISGVTRAWYSGLLSNLSRLSAYRYHDMPSGRKTSSSQFKSSTDDISAVHIIFKASLPLLLF